MVNTRRLRVGLHLRYGMPVVQAGYAFALPTSAASSGTLLTSKAWCSMGVFLPGCGVASAPGATSSWRFFFSCWTFLSWAMLRGSVIV